MAEPEWSHEVLPDGGHPSFDGGPRVSTWLWGIGAWACSAIAAPSNRTGPNYLVMSDRQQQDRAAEAVRLACLRLPPGTTHVGVAWRISEGRVEAGLGAAAGLDRTEIGWPRLPGRPKWLRGDVGCAVDEAAAVEDLMREVRRLEALLGHQRVRELLDLELVRGVHER